MIPVLKPHRRDVDRFDIEFIYYREKPVNLLPDFYALALALHDLGKAPHRHSAMTLNINAIGVRSEIIPISDTLARHHISYIIRGQSPGSNLASNEIVCEGGIVFRNDGDVTKIGFIYQKSLCHIGSFKICFLHHSELRAARQGRLYGDNEIFGKPQS